MLNGMTCDACGKVIVRVAEQNGAQVRDLDPKAGYATFDIEEARLGELKRQLAEKGFTERKAGDGSRGDPRKVIEFMRAVIAREPRVEVEGALLVYGIAAAAILFIAAAAGYATVMQGWKNAAAYLPFLPLIIAGSVATALSYKHMMCYRESMSCSLGMMVGMTVGMAGGYFIGALVGATNGMFMGCIAGMAGGIAIGAKLGRFSGVMGAMEGVMAGLMSGLMGAMTAVMLINDNLILFLYIFFGICIFVLGGLSYMMYREAGAAPRDRNIGGFDHFFIMSLYLALALCILMFFGPRGPTIYP
jgi:hypothetical protein